MHTVPPLRTAPSIRLLGLGLAVLATASQLVGADVLARARSVSSHAQIVELPRVVVTGQRLVAKQPVALRASASAIKS